LEQYESSDEDSDMNIPHIAGFLEQGLPGVISFSDYQAQEQDPDFALGEIGYMTYVMKCHEKFRLEQGESSEFCSGKKNKGGTRQPASRLTLYPPAPPGAVRVRGNILATEEEVAMCVTLRQTLGGAAAVSIRFNPNDIWQPLVGGATGTLVQGYTARALQYAEYRVCAYEYEFVMVNTEAFPIDVFVLNADTDQGTAPDVSLSSNPLCQSFTLSAQGGMDRYVFRKTIYLAELTGSMACYTNDANRAVNNGSPADPVWCQICAQSATGTSLTTGVKVRTRLMPYTLWYSRLPQAN